MERRSTRAAAAMMPEDSNARLLTSEPMYVSRLISLVGNKRLPTPCRRIQASVDASGVVVPGAYMSFPPSGGALNFFPSRRHTVLPKIQLRQSAIEGAAIGQLRGRKHKRVSDKFNTRKQGGHNGLDFVLQLCRGWSSRSRLVGGGVQHIRHLLLGLRPLTALGFEFSLLGFKFSSKHIHLVGETALARGESLDRGDKSFMKLVLMPLRGGDSRRKKGYSKILGISGLGAGARCKLGSENPSEPVLDIGDVRTLELDEPISGQALDRIAEISAHSRDENPFLTNDRGRALRVENRTFDYKIGIRPVCCRPSAMNFRGRISTFARQKSLPRRFDPLAGVDRVGKSSPDRSLPSIAEENDSAVRLVNQLSVVEDCNNHGILCNWSS